MEREQGSWEVSLCRHRRLREQAKFPGSGQISTTVGIGVQAAEGGRATKGGLGLGVSSEKFSGWLAGDVME